MRGYRIMVKALYVTATLNVPTVPFFRSSLYNRKTMRDLPDLFAALATSDFRRRFRLGAVEERYLGEKGIEVINHHARNFIQERLAPAHPKNDGRQTPMRGHPVFVAQHATATCCRSCLKKWHGIEKGVDLSPGEIEYVVRVLTTWIERQCHSENGSGATHGMTQQELFE